MYTGPKYIADPGARRKSLELGRECDTRWSWIRFQEELDRGEEPPFFSDPDENKCGRCGRLGHNTGTCSWPLSQVQIVVAHHRFVLMFTSFYVYECFTSFYFIFLFVLSNTCSLYCYLIFVGWRHRTCSIRTTSRTTEDDAPRKGR
jgi:hypothetical protein